MTPRWSNPSGSFGIHWFHVWPDRVNDSYNTADLTNNFDMANAIIGQPSSGVQWPPTTGTDGGIYREVAILQDERVPIGTVTAWWRPNGGIAIPTGWVECRGQTLTAGQHGFAGGGTITLPNLLNSYLVGADSTVTAGQAPAAAGTTNINSTAGAAGLGAQFGSNQTVLSVANLPAHDHGGGAHVHTLIDPGHTHPLVDPSHAHPIGANGAGGSGQHYFHPAALDNALTLGFPNIWFATEQVRTGVTIQSATTSATIASSGPILNTVGTSTPYDNRPTSTAVVWLMKVLYATSP